MKQDNELLIRRVEKILPSREGLEKLISQRKIRLYLGIDPTGFQLHIGHGVVLKKIQEFIDAGLKNDIFTTDMTRMFFLRNPEAETICRELISAHREIVDKFISPELKWPSLISEYQRRFRTWNRLWPA